MNISVSYYTEIGGRETNEDAVSLMENGDAVLGIVADGLGGHDAGEVASKMAVNVIHSEVMHEPVSVPALREAIQNANHAIWKEREQSSMKTTVAALWFDDKDAIAANVGDTRIYQFRNGKLVFQSRDHSVAQLSVQAGDLRPEDVRRSRERHKLTRALGVQDEVKVDVNPLRVHAGDAFLLCSDGFWDKIEEPEMAEDLAGAESARAWLVRMRKRLDGRAAHAGDNHSAITILIR